MFFFHATIVVHLQFWELLLFRSHPGNGNGNANEAINR